MYMLIIFFFFFPHLFSGRTRSPKASTYRVLRKDANTRASSGFLAAAKHRELPAHVGQDLTQLRRVPGEIAPPASGSSSSDAATARCAASASRPDHRATQAARAAARSGTGTSKARCPASKRSQVAASAPKRPPTSTPTTTKRQRRARTSSG